MGGSYKSIFKPSNPQKYQGNANNIICRSNWERQFCLYCDKTPNILRWASEEFSIPYVSPTDGKVHRYYPDFLIEVNENDKVKKYVVEVKPKKQTTEPKKPKKVTKSYLYEAATYAVNQAKWKAAREFCLDNGVEFKIITEDELYGTRRLPRKHRK